MNFLVRMIDNIGHDPIARAEFTSIALFILTALLLLLTYKIARQDWAEISSWASIGSVILAVHFMIVAWHEVATRQRIQHVAEGAGRVIKDCADCPEVVVTQSGLFIMGAVDADAGREEGPLRKVMIFEPFAIGVRAVSTAEYAAFASVTGRKAAPCEGSDNRNLSACVSWREAQDYTAWLTARTGHTYRLASAAEWEYAARAGSTPPAREAGNIPSAASSLSAAEGGNRFGVTGMGIASAELVADCWSPTLAGIPSDGKPLLPWTRWGVVRRVSQSWREPIYR